MSRLSHYGDLPPRSAIPGWGLVVTAWSQERARAARIERHGVALNDPGRTHMRRSSGTSPDGEKLGRTRRYAPVQTSDPLPKVRVIPSDPPGQTAKDVVGGDFTSRNAASTAWRARSSSAFGVTP